MSDHKVIIITAATVIAMKAPKQKTRFIDDSP